MNYKNLGTPLYVYVFERSTFRPVVDGCRFCHDGLLQIRGHSRRMLVFEV